MSEPTRYLADESPPTAAKLERECHRLIRQIARKPGRVKLLMGALAALQMYSDYKTNRTWVRTRPP